MDIFFIITTLMSLFLGIDNQQREQFEQRQEELSEEIASDKDNINADKQLISEETSPLNFIGGMYNKYMEDISKYKMDEQNAQANKLLNEDEEEAPHCFYVRLHHARFMGKNYKPRPLSKEQTKQWEKDQQALMMHAKALRQLNERKLKKNGKIQH